MKLLSLTFSIIILIKDVVSQKFPQEQFSFPPQFQTPSSGVFPSDNLLYLPPESHTTLPYFPLKDFNKLPYQYLPPTGTKAPAVYPTPFPLMFSSTLVPNFDDDEEDDNKHQIRISTPRPQPSPPPNKMNKTEKVQQPPQKEMRSMPKLPNYSHQIDRNDMKFSTHLSPNYRIPAPPNQASSAQRMIISPETHRNDHIIDQVKTASFQGNQYFPQPGSYFQSTTEPAIPIIRLSNEMDLDGSFSYEALGADQTHYVQHSRMENMGSDKEEQVVEGSYSYVGDNGQTYTVHYVADSNGFRASGDHLPVPPPMPEIIQRAVQYNLAEEAKKPPHLRSWTNEETFSEEKSQHYPASPPRNLFTGRNPEAFSYGFSQGHNQNNNNNNNIIPAASSQVPIKTSPPLDFSAEQHKPKGANGAPISPQITFLASQGAHVPSINAPQLPISRLFSTEKSTLPQLMNYEADVKDLDEENSKALWRWQYGLTAVNANENQNKNTISRSSSENDDIMINFGDMTSDQYTKMMRSQLEPNLESLAGQAHDSMNNNNHQTSFYSNNYQNVHSNIMQHNVNFEDNKDKIKTEVKPNPLSENTVTFPHSEDWYSKTQNYYNSKETQQHSQEQQQQQREQLQNQQYELQLQQQKQRIEPEQQIQFQQRQKQEEEMHNIQQEEERLLKLEEQKLLKKEENKLLKQQEMQIKQQEEQLKQQQEEIKRKEQLHKQILHDEELKESKPAEYHKNIITHHNFKVPLSQTVTQSYDYEDTSYEPRRIKSYSAVSTPIIETTNRIEYVTTPRVEALQGTNDISTNSDESSPHSIELVGDEVKAELQPTITQEPQFLTTTREIKFTDFIVHNDENDKFKPVIQSKTYIINQDMEKELFSSTTTESSTENILLNNIFLRNFVKPGIKEKHDTTKKNSAHVHRLNENKIIEKPKPKAYADNSSQKIPQFIQYQPKPHNEMKVLKKKPLDIADLLNYVSHKNHFESSKTKTNGVSKTFNDFSHKNEMHFVPIEDHRHKETHDNHQNKNESNQRNHQSHEHKGVFKNYKILQRNNNMSSDVKDQHQRELSPPPLTMLQAPGLPPLGRAGPSMKSYLPPIYV